MKLEKTIYILIFILASLGTFAQDVGPFFVDSTGRLFIRPGTPVNLYMSTNPEGTDAIKLQSIEKDDAPIIWDGHGPQQLTHMDLYLGRNVRLDIFVDGKPPVTSATFSVAKGFQRDNTLFISGAAIVELKGFDPNSGVNTIFHSINQSPFEPYRKPLIFDREGEYALSFYSIDNVGNKEDEGQRNIVVDNTPPVTTKAIEGPQHNEVIAFNSQFTLHPTDANGIRETFYSINNAEFLRYIRPIGVRNLPEGEHTISWYSVDMVGNEEEKQTFNFFVDRTPPMVFEEIVGNTYIVAGREFSSGRSQLRIVAVDNKAGVREIHYSINKEPFKLYEKPIFLAEITGAVSVRSYAIDNVGNRGISDAEGQQFSMPEVDITGPDIRYSYTGSRLTLRDTLWIGPKTKVHISANDKGSGLDRIEYRVNDDPPIGYTESFSVTNPGYHRITTTAWDNVENLNIINFGFGVDSKAPEIFYQFSVKPHRIQVEEEETIPVFTSGISIYIGATDDIAGVDRILVSINDAKERPYTQPLTGFRANQTHSVTIRAIDRLGNENEKTFRFRIE